MSSSPAPVRTPPLPRCLHKPPDSARCCQILGSGNEGPLRATATAQSMHFSVLVLGRLVFDLW
jgi:hypothetical protein